MRPGRLECVEEFSELAFNGAGQDNDVSRVPGMLGLPRKVSGHAEQFSDPLDQQRFWGTFGRHAAQTTARRLLWSVIWCTVRGSASSQTVI